MAKSDETSFELDVEESSTPAKKPHVKTAPLRKHAPKKKVHHVPQIDKEVPKKESPQQDPAPSATPAPEAQQHPQSVKAHSDGHADNKLPNSRHESLVVQPTKEDSDFLGIKVDPVVAAVVGTAAAVAGTAAVASGIATPAITAAKAGIMKVKAAFGLTSKAAAVVGGAAVAAGAVMLLEKKLTNYEADIQAAKGDVSDISDQLKKLDQLLDKVKK